MKCYKLVNVKEKEIEEFYGKMTADLDDEVEVPISEAVPVKVKVANYIGWPGQGGWLIEKELQTWLWKGQSWIEVEKFEKELC